jgi:hypothetical protein
MAPGKPKLCAAIASVGAKRRKSDLAGLLFSWTYMRRNTDESFCAAAQSGETNMALLIKPIEER